MSSSNIADSSVIAGKSEIAGEGRLRVDEDHENEETYPWSAITVLSKAFGQLNKLKTFNKPNLI